MKTIKESLIFKDPCPWIGALYAYCTGLSKIDRFSTLPLTIGGPKEVLSGEWDPPLVKTK